MRFKQLTIHNIASIADATIHFDKKPLAGESLFLICGETGSGKTTILDAICLALYKTTPRIKQSKSEKYIDDSLQVISKGENEGIQVSDPRQYLRRGSLEGFVELTFVGNAGEDCTARIVFSIVKASNNLKKAEWSLEVDHTLITSDKDIKAKIVEVVGFDFEQFCRTTMLAQGEFTRFLKSGETEKSDILEKLTGTEIYSEIGKRIFKVTQTKNAAKEKADIELKAIEEPKEEELEQLAANIRQFEQESNNLVEQQRVAEGKKTWLETEKKLIADEQKAVAELAEWESKNKDGQVIEDRKTVAQWHRTEKERQAVVALKKSKQQEEINLTENNRLEQTYKRLISGELFRNNEIETKQNEVKTLDGQLESEQRYAAMYAESQWIVAKLQQHLEDAAKAEQYAAKAKDEKAKLPEKEKAWEQCKEALVNAREALNAKEDLVKGKQAELNQLNPSQLNQDLQQLRKLLQEYAEAEIMVKNQQQAAKEWKEATKRIEELQQTIQEKTSELETLNPQVTKAQEDYDAAKTLYEKTKLSLGDYAKALRHELHEGDVCPVCGNKVTKIEHDEALEQALKPVYEVFKVMEQDLNKWVDAKKTLEADIKSLGGNVETAIKFGQQKAEVLQIAKTAMVSACAKLKIDSDADDLVALIAEQKATKSAELDALNEKWEKAQYKQQEINDLTQEKETAVLLEKEAKEAADVAEKGLSELKASIKNSEDLAAQKRKDSDQALKEISNKMSYPDWQTDVPQTIARLTADAKRFEQWQKQKQQLESQIDTMTVARDLARKTCSQVKTLFPTWAVSHEAQQVADLDDAWSRLLGEATKLNESMVNTQKQTRENQNIIESFLGADKEIDRARLEVLSAMMHSQIVDKESALSGIEKGLQIAQGALTQVRKNHKDHALSKPEMEEDDTFENIGNQIDAIKASLSDLAQKIGEVKAQINAKVNNRAEYNRRKLVFDQADQEWQKWDGLRKVFGDSEGKLFRVIAQSFVLRELLSHANTFLHNFSDRYELICQNNLTILVRDLYYGGVARPVDLVSGGESFIVSLALALGLSSLNRNSLSADILFIDEGFGTLDPNVLELVMNALGQLQVLGDRRVGIISHVEALERIPVKIFVEKVDNTTSKIRFD